MINVCGRLPSRITNVKALHEDIHVTMPPNRENGRHHIPIPPLFAPEAVSNELARCLNELALEMRARQIPEDRLWGPDGILETLMHRQDEFSGINRPYLRRQVVEEAIRRLRSADDQPREKSTIKMLCLVALALGLFTAFYAAVFRPAPTDPFVDGVIKDACELHVRWAHATHLPPAQVDLYSALDSDKVAFSGSIDEFAGRFSTLMEAKHCEGYDNGPSSQTPPQADPAIIAARASARSGPLPPSAS